ncbi:MAG: tetratricopeptide repeat protein, partial [Pseudomonadota bacterium]
NTAEDKLETLLNATKEMEEFYPTNHTMAVDGIVKGKNEIGLHYHSLNNHTIALDYLLESYNILKEYHKDNTQNHPYIKQLTDNIRSIANPLDQLAIKALNNGEYDESTNIFKQLLGVVQNVFPGSRMIVSKYAEYLGTGYFKWNQCELAIEPLKLSLEQAMPEVVSMLNSCEQNKTENLKDLFLNHIVPRCQALGNYTSLDECYNAVSEVEK